MFPDERDCLRQDVVQEEVGVGRYRSGEGHPESILTVYVSILLDRRLVRGMRSDKDVYEATARAPGGSWGHGWEWVW